MLQEQEIRTPQDLSHDIPGLSVQSSFRGQSALMWIRGVPGVITYFADVPTALAFGAFYFDLDNVQALKGPQGTLFGLNADAGAILFQPKKPTGDFEGFAQVTLGDYNRHTFDGVANIPVVPDNPWYGSKGNIVIPMDSNMTKPRKNIYMTTIIGSAAFRRSCARPTISKITSSQIIIIITATAAISFQ